MTESSASSLVSAASFRMLMSEFPSGGAVITTMDDNGRPWGMTCSALCSLSVSPPTLLVCLRAQSATLAVIQRQSAFAVNLVHTCGQPIAELFASGNPRRFRLVHWTAGLAGPHLDKAAHAIADCRVSRTQAEGSHVIVFGEVLAVTRTAEHAPLLYGRRRYNIWPE